MRPLCIQFSVPPQIVPFTFGDEAMYVGDAASAQCTITKGDSPVDIKWYQNGHLIGTEDGITIMQLSKRLSVLSIDSVRDTHAGNYTCRAANRAGTVEFTSGLAVNGTS